MRNILLVVFFCFLASACGQKDTPVTAESRTGEASAASETASASGEGLDYPVARRSDHTDDYFGTEVADPYRWMEDLDADEVQAWVEAENALAAPYLESLPGRQEIIDRTKELWSYERWDVPLKKAGRYFYEHNDGLQDQDVLYVANTLDEDPRVLIDANAFSDDSTIAVSRYRVSPDGRLIAYSLSDGGSDWTTMHFRNVDSGKDLEDVLADVKFTNASWAADNKGLYYERYPLDENGKADDGKQKRIFFHVLGTPQSDDLLVYEVDNHPTRDPSVQTTEDGRYLLISVTESYFENGLFYIDLHDPDAEVVGLFEDWDGRYEYLGNEGLTFYIKTTSEALNGRVIAVDLDQPDREHWREVVPEVEMPIQAASLGGEHVVVHYLEDAHSLVRLVRLSGTPDGEIPMPGLGTAYGYDADKPSSGDEDALSSRLGDPEIFFGFSSYTSPPAVYRFDMTNRQTTLVKAASTVFDREQYVTEQVFYESKDGTKIPMFVTHRKDLPKNGQQPTLLYGYGGFNVPIQPSYRTRWAVWLEMGGVLAMPNLRGGGEYGEEWHAAGTRARKQNVFDDFIAAAEWLIANDYTRPEKIAIFGGSNGGLLVGAVMLQRPDLFGASLAVVGVLDMLRYHTASANARMWSGDYGLSEDEADFRSQYAYSPYHNVAEETCYPATLITTGDHDDRVVPWHSYKFGAELQQHQACEKPILVRVETRAGHGAGKPAWMIIEEEADRFAFLRQSLGMDD
jgi:prolyl oligopeptidase